MRICRRTRRLHDENIGAAYVLFNLKIELAVGKSRCLRTSEIATQLVANLFRQRAIRIAGRDFDAAGRTHSMSDKFQLVATCRLLVDKLKFVGHSLSLAGAEGFEPTNAGSKDRCLTTWLRPSIARRNLSQIIGPGFRRPAPSRFDSGRAQPSYKERRANQLRVRSPEWRAPERPDYQKSRTQPSRYLPTSPRAPRLSIDPLSLFQFQV